jgi:hypothetical protein
MLITGKQCSVMGSIRIIKYFLKKCLLQKHRRTMVMRNKKIQLNINSKLSALSKTTQINCLPTHLQLVHMYLTSPKSDRGLRN